MTLLEVANVSSTRTNADGSGRVVINGISFSVEGGEFLVLVGRSGGGKTTLLRLLNRLDEPSSGVISFQGRELHTLAPSELRRNVVLMAQRPTLFPGTVLDNVLLPLHLAQQRIEAQDEALATEALSACQISPHLHRQEASELSIGQQQRVALARALVLEPRVLVADEPTSALDRPTAMLVAQTLRRYARKPGRAAVMVSHDLELVAEYGDRMLFIDDGRVVEQGPPRQLLQSPGSEALRQFLARPSDDEGGAE